MLMRKTIELPNVMRDALQNMAPDSGASVDYAQGLFVGVMSMIMAFDGCSYEDAVKKVKSRMPANYRLEAIPVCWQADFMRK